MTQLAISDIPKEALNSFITGYIAKEQAQQLKKSNFMKTILFHKIIRSMIDNNIFLDEENFRYFPEQALSDFNIPELTQEDLTVFIDCMTDDELILSKKTFVEKDNSFHNLTSEKLGLRVFMMWGQGCCIQIFPQSIDRRGDK